MKRKKKERKLHSLKSCQYGTFIVSFLLPSFALFCLLLVMFINNDLTVKRQECKNTLDILSTHFSGTINSDLEMSLTYFFDKDVENFYSFLNTHNMDGDLVAYNQFAAKYDKTVNSYMTLLNKNIRGITFIPKKNNTAKCFYTERYQRTKIINNYQYHAAGWYKKLKDGKENILFTKGGNNNEDPSLVSIIRTAKNVDKKETIGYIILNISLEDVYSLVDNLSISPVSGIVLSSPQGELLYSSNPSFQGIDPHKLSGDRQLSHKGNQYDVYSLSDGKYKFRFTYLSAKSDLYSRYRKAVYFVLLFYAAMVVVALLLFQRNSNEISRSIRPVLKTMAEYDAGDAEIQCDGSQCAIREISIISNGLNHMIRNINRHINNEYKLRMNQEIANYQALQAEVNPHFLYNVLNIFITLNRIGQKEKLEKAVISLSNMFRYTCEGEHDTTLREELSFIRNYLYLQKIRYEERLSFEISLEPGLEEFKIPKLIIQPLVENAIVHSLEPSEYSVTIRIGACTQTADGVRRVVISVDNDGLPFHPQSGGKDRIGLKNVRQRLKFYHKDSCLQIDGGVGKPTKCLIVIPTEGEPS